MWHKGSTPIKSNVLEKYLAEYNNRGDADILLSGFKYGFRLQYAGPLISVRSKNIVSVDTHKAEAQIKFDKEIKWVEFWVLFLRNQFLP